MEFEHVQHTLDVCPDSEETARKVRELCSNCRGLIFPDLYTVSPVKCVVVVGDDDAATALSSDDRGSSNNSYRRSPPSDVGISPSLDGTNNFGTVRNHPASPSNNDDGVDSGKVLSSVVAMTADLEAITGHYMNQPTLLYPHIESLVAEPFDLLRSFIQLPSDQSSAILLAGSDGASRTAIVALEHLCYHIYNVSKVVGVRRIISCAPNEVRFLVPVTVLIEHMHKQTRTCYSIKYESKRWCLEYVLLVWLSMLVYTPFALDSIWRDEDVDGALTLQGRIISVSTHYLNQSTKARDAAAIVLSTLYSRPDVSDVELSTFMSHCTRVLKNASKTADRVNDDVAKPNTSKHGVDIVTSSGDSSSSPSSNSMNAVAETSVLNDDSDIFASPSPRMDIKSMPMPPSTTKDESGDMDGVRKGDVQLDLCFSTGPPMLNDHSQIGVLTVLKQMLKRMSRDDLSSHILHIAKCLLNKEWAPSSTACRKLNAACLGRLGVHLLPSQYSSQRYRRMCRQLIISFTADPVKDMPVVESFDIDDRIESILEHLLATLVDNDIRVRWASAKSIGRISVKLPMEFNEQIVEHILQIISMQFDPARMSFVKGEASVHGGCLALAEIIRNGILHPHMLNRVLDCVVLTLGFDVWRGRGSAGTAVRDASCYICWAIVRNFASSLLQPSHLIPMSKELVNMAVFDISINCRRSAGAAIQELVGRVGNIPHGLDLIVLADYYSVANRRNAFLNVSFEISKLGFYTLSMIDNLLRTKLHHPDITTRRLAATALGKISLALVDSPNSQLITRNGRPVYLELVETCVATVTSSTLGIMHGSLCALIQLLSGLLNHGELVADHFASIKEIPIIFERKRLFRLKGGTIIREAICNLIKFICRITKNNSCLSISADELNIYKVILKDCVRNFTLDVQTSAVEALDDFFTILFGDSPANASDFVEYLLRSLQNQKDHIAARRGYALAIGSSPIHLIPSLVEPVLTSLCDALVTNYDDPNIKDAQTRQHAVISLIRAIGRINDTALSSGIIESLVVALEFGCNDFEIDSRGDVGSWVREVSVEAIAYIHHLRNFNPIMKGGSIIFDNLQSSHVLRLVKCLIAACLETMDNTRARATFLFAHMFGGQFHFNVDWVWQRVFYGYCYEYDIARYGVFPESSVEMRSAVENASTCSLKGEYAEDINVVKPSYDGGFAPLKNVVTFNLNSVVTTIEERTSKQMECDSEDHHMSVDGDDTSHVDSSIGEGNRSCDSVQVHRGKTGLSNHEMTVLCSIAQNINWSIVNSYNIREILQSVPPSSMANQETLAKSQSNASLRLPGYSVAPQCFEQLMWLLCIPSFSFIVTAALVQVLGGISLQQLWNGRSLEQVVVDFIHTNSDLEMCTRSGESIKDMLMRYILEIYRAAIVGKNCKMCIRVVSSVRVLKSHRVLGDSPEFIDLLSAEPSTATNYNYLKCIVKCLQALYTSTSDRESARQILRVLIGFLEHQYPTLRFFAQSSLVLIFNDCDLMYNRDIVDSALDVLVSSAALEEHADCITTIDRLKAILNL